MKDSRDRIALVRKNKPTWQAGRLNGIGGGIEPGEHPLAAMRREWREETGTHFSGWIPFAAMCFSEAQIYFYKANVVELPIFPTFNDIGEKIEIWDYSIVVRAGKDNMIQNLKWLMPLAFEDPDGLSVVASVVANDNEYRTPLEIEADEQAGLALAQMLQASADSEGCYTQANGDCTSTGPCIHSVAA